MSSIFLPWPYRSSDPLSRLHRDFSLLFDDLYKQQNPPSLDQSSSPYTFALDVQETDKAILIHAELPGLKEENIIIDLNDSILTIRGEKKFETSQKDKKYHIRERTQGSFIRSLQLPKDIEEDKIKANFYNGILEITIPKAEESKSKNKRISISQSPERKSIENNSSNS